MKTERLTMLAWAAAASLSVATFAPPALADVMTFSFNGSGISASGTLTASQSATPGVDEITDITGSFSDTNIGVSGAITGLYQPVSYVSDTSAGIAFTSAGLSYDDLLYPAGDSPALCFDPVTHALTYPFSGGQLDIFGVTFDIAGGYVGEFWSNGDIPGVGVVYAAAVANATTLLDDPNAGEGDIPPGEYGSFTAASVPEPGSLLLLGTGLLGLVAVTALRRRSRSPRYPAA